MGQNLKLEVLYRQHAILQERPQKNYAALSKNYKVLSHFNVLITNSSKRHEKSEI